MNIFNPKSKLEEHKTVQENLLNNLNSNIGDKFLITNPNETHKKPQKANLGFIESLIRSNKPNLKSKSQYSNQLNELNKSETIKHSTPITNKFDLPIAHIDTIKLHPKRTNNASGSYDIFNYVLPKGKPPKYELTAINMASKSIKEAVELQQNDDTKIKKIISDSAPEHKKTFKEILEDIKKSKTSTGSTGSSTGLTGGFEERKGEGESTPKTEEELETQVEIDKRNWNAYLKKLKLDKEILDNNFGLNNIFDNTTNQTDGEKEETVCVRGQARICFPMVHPRGEHLSLQTNISKTPCYL